MTAPYYSIITNAGLINHANAANNSVNLDLTQMAVGDSNGVYYDPDGTELALVNETHRVNLTHVVIDENNQNQLIVEAVLDEVVGPFYIREVGIFDSNGDLFAIGKYPETFKPNLPTGSGKRLYIRMILGFANSPSVNLVINNDIALDPNFGTDVNNRLDFLDSKIGKNYVINGNFDVWQRGVLFNSNSSVTFCADRWQYKHDATGSGTVERKVFSVEQNEVPNNPRYFLRHNQVTSPATSSLWFLRQYIEDVRTLAGKNVTLSFYIKADKNITASCLFRNSFGNSNYSDITQSNFNITTSWQKIVLNNSYPAIPAGMTLESNSSNQFTLDVPADVFVIDIAQVQLEEGNVATNFELRHIRDEIALCQRYYEKSYNIDTSPGSVAGGTMWLNGAYADPYLAMISMQFKVEKRIAPSVTIYSPTGTINRVQSHSGDLTVSSIADVGTHGIGRVYTSNTSSVSQSWRACHYVADAEL